VEKIESNPPQWRVESKRPKDVGAGKCQELGQAQYKKKKEKPQEASTYGGARERKRNESLARANDKSSGASLE